jgi:hypothetical protein
LQGLQAAERDDFVRSKELLDQAAADFEAIGHFDGQRTVQLDLLRIGLWAGAASGIDAILKLEQPRNTSEILLVARALRRDARFESAIQLIKQQLNLEDVPSLCLRLYHELILLCKLRDSPDTTDIVLRALKL